MSENDKLYHKIDTPISTSSQKSKDTNINNGKGFTKFAKQALSGIQSTVNSSIDDAVNFAKGLKTSAIDALTTKDSRNGDNKSLPSDFDVLEVSIANRHTDAINNILNGVSSGDIFGTGIQILNLVNFGTKWSTAKAQYVDKDSYSFKYSYMYEKDTNLSQGELPEKEFVKFLDTIEDPTIFNYSLKLDYVNSPLFSGFFIDGVPTDNPSTTNNNSSLYFINQYQPQIRELAYGIDYMKEFSNCISKIFSSPESENGANALLANKLYKNHYIYEINGLDKLDNKFVKCGNTDEEHDSLEFTIGEDIRMYVKRMIFLYKNFSYSYNMGKKLIPENLLRFNLYIKISDMRNYTSETSKIDEGYSRMIYELKDCEFLFDGATLPSSIKMSGFNTDNDSNFNDIKIKIKYRKVNRIFYSEMYGNTPFVIGDKYYVPNTEAIYSDLDQSIKFASRSTTKRKSTSNNIPVVESFNHKLNNLKTKGIFNDKENDNAVGRFVKGIGNQAVKTGASLASEGLQNLKNNVNNNIGKDLANTFNNNISTNVRNLLKSNVESKINELGLNIYTKKQYSSTAEVINDDSKNPYNSDIPKNDDDTNSTKVKIHPISNENVDNTLVVIKSIVKENTNSTSVNVKPITKENTNSTSVNVKPITKEDTNSTNVKITTISNENVDTTNVVVKLINKENTNSTNVIINNIPKENINNGNINVNTIKDENINSGLISNINNPNENINSTFVKNTIITDENINNITQNVIKNPNENVNTIVNNNTLIINENVNSGNITNIKSPNENIVGDININNKLIVDNNISNTNVNVKPIKDENINSPFKKYIITTPPPNDKIDGLDENK